MKQAEILTAFLAVGAPIWLWVCLRWRRGEPIIPLARRRPVPWQGQDVLFIFLIGFLLPITSASVVGAWVGNNGVQQAADLKPDLSHPAEQMLRSSNLVAIAVATTMAVIVAPLVEEFFFRVLLQGWLEAVWSRKRRRRPELRAAPMSWIPIVLPAALFALMHVRSGNVPLAPRYLLELQLGQMAAELVALGLAVMLLRYAARATAADLGWQAEKLRSDVKLGLWALLAVVGPLLLLQFAMIKLTSLTGINYSLDPVPLFFLALVFGVLYHRTHRLAPSLLLHMAFNATSIALIYL